MKTIRSQPGPSVWIPLALLVGGYVTIAVFQPDLVLWLLASVLLVALIIWGQLRATRLEITETVVRARQGWWVRVREAPRSEIRAIHFFPSLISFRGPDRKPIMKVGPNWTLRQMLEVAGELAVPLYDHRRWLGLRTVKTGRLVNPPGHPLSRGGGATIRSV